MVEVKGRKTSRREKAAQTRLRMLDAAYELFCEVGFRASTMDLIAERAGVAVQTLYFSFHTKDELVQAVHEHTVLGEDGVPPPQQAWYRAAVAEPDIAKAVGILVDGMTVILERVAPMVPAFQAVAGDPAGEVWRHGQQLRYDGMVDLVDTFRSKSRLRRGLSRAHGADLFFVLLGPDLYRSLVIERGWSKGQWSAWVQASLMRDVFDAPTRSTSPR